MEALYLLGDIFDFWYEYNKVAPKGYIRFLGALARLSDAGIPLYLFSGNHDLWYRDYLPEQLNIEIYREPLVRELKGKKFYLAHGDGLGPGDHGYKFLKSVLVHPLSKWLFARLHPDFGFALAATFSSASKNHNVKQHGEIGPDYGENDYLYIHAQSYLQQDPTIDHFVFGHRHLFKEMKVGEQSSCLFLGDWIVQFSYLEISDNFVGLRKFPIANKPSLPSA